MRVYIFLLVICICSLVLTIALIVSKKFQPSSAKEDELYNIDTIDDGKIPYILHKTGPFSKYSIPKAIENAMNRSAKHLCCVIKYYDDDDCIQLISQNFHPNVLKAYNMLKPTAYKADLFRYCCLYLYGGVYSDIGHEIFQDYQINQDNVDMVLVKDRIDDGHKCRMQISFMATFPLNNFYKYLIEKIVLDILDKKYGSTSLDITGPDAFGKYFSRYFKINNIENLVNPRDLKGIDGIIYKN